MHAEGWGSESEQSVPEDHYVEDDELVVRFGESPDQTLVNGAEDHQDEHANEWAVSAVVGRGLTPAEIAKQRPWMKRSRNIHVAYAADIREANLDVYSDGRPHANVVFPEKPELGQQQLSVFREVFVVKLPNPNFTAEKD